MNGGSMVVDQCRRSEWVLTMLSLMWQVTEQLRLIRGYIQISPYRCRSISIMSSPTLRQVGDLGDGWRMGNKRKYFDESPVRHLYLQATEYVNQSTQERKM